MCNNCITSNETFFIIIEDFLSLNETSRLKSTRKYGCPYCDLKFTIMDLISHIEDEHEEMIPQNQTPAQVIFNYVNNKTHGSCIICGKNTKWNESAWRYDRLCSEKCKDNYIKEFRKRMIGSYGKIHLLNDPEQQKLMLAGRKISGEYTFSDGGVKSYCGSYELKLLEFMDKVLEIPSSDILTPGPIFYYEFNGKSLTWITDIYYIPFNLVFDVKDGGTNKNTHPQMEEYRQKQVAKEKTIMTAKTHNYIRLTDNDFTQLLYIMGEIKKNIITNVKEPIIRINESYIEDLSSKIVPDSIYMIPYTFNGYITDGVAYSKDLLCEHLIIHNQETGCNEIVDKSYLENAYYSIIKVEENANEIYKQLLHNVKNRTPIYEYNYMSCLNNIHHIEEIPYNECKVLFEGYDLSKFDIMEKIKNMGKVRSVNEEFIPGVSLVHDNIVLCESLNGFSYLNKKNGRMTECYKDKDSISNIDIALIKEEC